jgi:hypothetical protein
LLNPIQREHLGDQQIQDIILDARPILQRAGHFRRETPLGVYLAKGALLDLDGHVGNHLLKEDVDPGASFVSLTGRLTEALAAALAPIDFDDLNGFDGACVLPQQVS